MGEEIQNTFGDASGLTPALSVSSPPAPPGFPPPGRRLSFKRPGGAERPPAWFRERARMLQRICQSIERRRERGQTVRKAVVYFGWYWHGRSCRTAPGIKVRLGATALKNIYYRWRRSGKKIESFQPNYRLRPVVDAALVSRFLDACAAAGVGSMTAAWGRLNAGGVSLRALVAALPARKRLAIRAAHRSRRDLMAKDRALGQKIRGLARKAAPFSATGQPAATTLINAPGQAAPPQGPDGHIKSLDVFESHRGSSATRIERVAAGSGQFGGRRRSAVVVKTILAGGEAV